MKTLACAFVIAICLVPITVFTQQHDLSRGKTLYVVGYAHLDTQWRWDYRTTIEKYLWNTLEDNFSLFRKYPDYVFNFSGANRYMFMKEYYPAQYDSMKSFVAAGRWFPAGSSMEENDVLSPSAESDIRQILYGNDFFRREFGKASEEFMLPDCFGFPASLPSVLAHCGLRGFSTQKLTWGSAVGIPFNVGRWIGTDGRFVVAALNPGSYGADIAGDLSKDSLHAARIAALGKRSGVFADYMYYGTGDMGGAPTAESVDWLEKSLHPQAAIQVVPATADAMFRDMTDAQKAKLPSYRGEFLLTNHSAGSINSAAVLKRWNRKNELLAAETEAAAIMGTWLGADTYDQARVNKAWRLVLSTQFHDMLPGTVVPKAFEFAWNDELLAANQFAHVFVHASEAVIGSMETRAEGIPVVVFNPLAFDRSDLVEATIVCVGEHPRSFRVFNAAHKEVPSQITAVRGDSLTVLFLASMRSLGYQTYDVRPSAAPCALNTGLRVSSSELENPRYVVKLNAAGDVSSVYDKSSRKELLSSPLRLAFLHEKPREYPAWNMDWADRKNPPEGYVEGPATVSIVENGPAAVALEVRRTAQHSSFVQRIRLAADGDRVEFRTFIDWATTGSSLKQEFPLTVSNSVATYNCDIGTVCRGNNDSVKFEVPSHQWFDLTDRSGAYGVSILEDCKNGSDKPADNVVRLTLLYTPAVRNHYKDQAYQDFGKHEMLYAIYGHRGSWQDGNSRRQGSRLNQPMTAFVTFPHTGVLGSSWSFLSLSDPAVEVMALKKAEHGDAIILRVVEGKGRSCTNVQALFGSAVVSAREMDGQERELRPAHMEKGKLVFGLTPYQPKTFAVRLRPPAAKSAHFRTIPVELPFDVDAISSDKNRSDGDFDGEGRTLPAEMLPDTLLCEGVTFVLGPKADHANNAVACNGQTLKLPEGKATRVYVLAAAVDSTTEGFFSVGGERTAVSVDSWSGYFGQWDNRLWDKKDTSETNFTWDGITFVGVSPGYVRKSDVALFTQHRHMRNGKNDVYAYAYLYKYAIDLPPNAKEIRLPSNNRIRLFAMSVSDEAGDIVQEAQPLFDTMERK